MASARKPGGPGSLPGEWLPALRIFSKSGPAGYESSIMGTVPSTGTHIHLVNDEVLGELLRPYADQIFYLGQVYGSKPKLLLWFKHFDRGADGAGEAYHLGIFGKTGSGKSVLAKMILLAYARYPKMALLVIDPQGEFAGDLRGAVTGEFPLPMKEIIKSMGKATAILTVRNLVLDRWELFVEILFKSPFFEGLTVPKGENRQIACDVLADKLKKKITLEDLYQQKSFQEAWKILADEKIQRQFYRTDASRTRFNTALGEADPKEFYEEFWKPVAELFRRDRPQAKTVNQALSWLLNPEVDKRPLLVIDLSKEQAKGLFWNDRIQALVIKRLLDGLTQTAEYFFRERQSLNALVVIDEAHRLAPRELPKEDDFQALRQLVGSTGPALDLYQLFRDPHSSFDPTFRRYSFMTIGPVSPLSFSGTPLFSMPSTK